MKTKYTIFITFLICLTNISLNAQDDIIDIHKIVKHANTNFWFGLDEIGDIRSYNKALDFLDEAETLTNSLELSESKSILNQINSLKDDLIQQKDLAHDTFAGVFPMVKLLGFSLFTDNGVLGNYEILDDPYVVSSTESIENLINAIGPKFNAIPQMDVVVSSDPFNLGLINESLNMFNASTDYYVHTNFELAHTLSADQFAQFKSGEFSSDIILSLMDELKLSTLLVVHLKLEDSIDGLIHFVCEGRVFKGNPEIPLHSIYTMGFCRDRSFVRIPLLAITIIMALFSILLYNHFFISKSNEGTASILTPLIGFCIGYTLPWFLIPLIMTIQPELESLFLLSFWWYGLLGLTLYLTPALLLLVYISRLQNLFSSFSLIGKGGRIICTVGCGICSYISIPYLAYNGISYTLIPIIISTILFFYILGRTIDSKDVFPGWIISVTLFEAISFGFLIVSHHNVLTLSISLSNILLNLFLLYIFKEKKHLVPNSINFQNSIDDVYILNNFPEEMIKRLTKPCNELFIKPRIYSDIRPFLDQFVDGDSFSLGLSGSAGVGKSTISNALSVEIRELFIAKKKNILVVNGYCQESSNGYTPYEPFSQAFSHIKSLSVLLNDDSQLLDLSKKLGGLAESILPVPTDILFPDDDENTEKTKYEIHLAIGEYLKKAAKKNPILIIIDDIQWIDPDSDKLLHFLLGYLSKKDHISFVIAGRENKNFSDLNIDKCFRIDELTPSEQEKYLVEKLHFTQNTAKYIQKAIKHIQKIEGSKTAGMFSFLQSLSFLLQEGVFKLEEDKVVIEARFNQINKLPVSPGVKAIILDKIDSKPEYKKILECAACIGLGFTVDILANSLSMNRLDLLAILEKIENDTGLVYDEKEEDNIYYFSSSYILENMREQLFINGDGPASNNVPQLIREYHARLASSMEKEYSKGNNSKLITNISRHYFAAGKAYAKKAVDYLLLAGEEATKNYASALTFEYYEMIEECCDCLSDKQYRAIDQLVLFLDAAYISGEKLKSAAEKGFSWFSTHENIPSRIMSKLCRNMYLYSIESFSQENFKRLQSLSMNLIDKSDNPFFKAEGYQFLGLSYRSGDDENYKNLIKALDLLSENYNEDYTQQLLEARIENSLGRCYMAREEYEKAENILLKSLKTKIELNDKKGQAFSYGALGDLYFFYISSNESDRKNEITKAVEFYKRDLEISKKIGDIDGVRTMNSKLGGCFEQLEEYKNACEYYDLSLESARKSSESPIDLFFALAGSIMNRILTNSPIGEIENLSVEMLHLFSESKPESFQANRLKEILEKSKKHQKAQWYSNISQIIQ